MVADVAIGRRRGLLVRCQHEGELGLHLPLFLRGDVGHAHVLAASRAHPDVTLESVITATETDDIRHGYHLLRACVV
jgi:hypothetical protein